MSASTSHAVMARHPIPDAALDDRLAFIGASGSGKTYAAGLITYPQTGYVAVETWVWS